MVPPSNAILMIYLSLSWAKKKFVYTNAHIRSFVSASIDSIVFFNCFLLSVNWSMDQSNWLIFVILFCTVLGTCLNEKSSQIYNQLNQLHTPKPTHTYTFESAHCAVISVVTRWSRKQNNSSVKQKQIIFYFLFDFWSSLRSTSFFETFAKRRYLHDQWLSIICLFTAFVYQTLLVQ